MQRIAPLSLSLLLVTILGCSEQPVGPDSGGISLSSAPNDAAAERAFDVTAELPAEASAAATFVAPLSGEQEVPEVETTARGSAVFRLSADGSSVSYRLMVANLHDVLMAHIHLAPSGENGPIVVWLYPQGPPPEQIDGRSAGVLAEGTFTADDLLGPLEGESLDALLDMMSSGGAYVNVHTSANGGGEIRGQIVRGSGPNISG